MGGGATTLVFSCLPAALDVQSLQVSADASVRIGETAVRTAPRAQSPSCADSPLDGRIRELEDRRAALQSEADALDLVNGYLKGISARAGDASERRAAPDAKSVTVMADALRRTGQDSLQKQHQLKRRQEELDRQLAPLLAERARSQGVGGNVVTVTVTLAAARDADVALSYQVPGPGWTPAYRAQLDTAMRKLRLERQALVAQATGEDWRGVKLMLSTGQPEPERDNQGESGLIGVRTERRLQRAYVVENRHRTPIAVQLLEAAPVSVDGRVRIEATFAPQPSEREWNRLPGMAMWRFDLAAGQSARVAAGYTISYPKDAALQRR